MDCLAWAQATHEQLNCNWTQILHVRTRQRKCRTDQIIRRFCSSGQKIQTSLYWIIAIDWTDCIKAKCSVDRVKFSTRSPLRRFQTKFGSTSTQVHQEEFNPPNRRVHKVRKALYTKSRYPSVSRSPRRQWRVVGTTAIGDYYSIAHIVGEHNFV